MKSIWLYRTEANIPEDQVHHCERYPMDVYLFTKLYILYDKPSNKKFCLSECRKMCEVPNYMFQEIEEGQCIEFKTENI